MSVNSNTTDTLVDPTTSAETTHARWQALRSQLYTLSDPPSFPREPLQVLQDEWPSFADFVRGEFIDWVDRQLDAAEPLKSDLESPLYFCCGFLLAQFRDPGCFELCQRMAMMKSERRDLSFGDSQTEIVVPWWASLCHHAPERIQWLDDLAACRVPALWQSICFAGEALARCASEGVISVAKAHDALRAACGYWCDHIQRGVSTDPQDPNEVFTCKDFLGLTVSTWIDAGMTAGDAVSVRTWFVRGWLHDDWMDAEALDAIIDPSIQPDAKATGYFSKAQTNQRKPGFARTVEAELGWWAWFQPIAGRDFDLDSKFDIDNYRDFMRQEMDRYDHSLPAPIEEPYVRPSAKVGRNDPCPCGSGKKFKKCCGG